MKAKTCIGIADDRPECFLQIWQSSVHSTLSITLPLRKAGLSLLLSQSSHQ